MAYIYTKIHKMISKVLTYDHERVITACHAEQKDETAKQLEISQAIELMKQNGVKFYKYENTENGALLGYGIFDANKNSLKKFDRH